MSFENRDEDETVTDTGEERADTKTGGTDAMRPIPDGGLQQSMPEWLRRPPAWRNLPKRDEAARPEPAEADVAVAPAKELPAPDTSEIDPRSLVDVADLPQWLQDVAARSDARSAEAAPVMTEPETHAAEAQTEESEMSNPENRNPVEIGTERSIPFEPVDKRINDVPDQETKTYGGGVPKQGANPILMGIIALAIIVVVVLVLMAIL